MHEKSSDENDARTPFLLEHAQTYAEYVQAHPAMAETMRARQQEIRLGPDDQLYLARFPHSLHMAVIAEPERAGTVVVVPLLARIADCMVRSSFWLLDLDTGKEVVRRAVEEADPVAELSARELPFLLLLDARGRYLGQWGPHPAGFASYMATWRVEHPEWDSRAAETTPVEMSGPNAKIERCLTHAMRAWYNSGLNAECVAEVCSLLETVEEKIEDAEVD